MSILLIILYLINLLFALFLIFYRERDTSVTWAWLLVFMFIPFLGFILYLFFGLGLSKKERYNIKNQISLDFESLDNIYDSTLQLYDDIPSDSKFKQLAYFMSNLNHTPLTHHNEVKVLVDGKKKLESLLHDIKKAQKFIHIEYYAFVTDETGMKVVDLLTEKAKEGVEICLLYDELGSKGVQKSKFAKLIEAGGKIQTFVTSKKAILKFRVNYHDHRKIVIIDGKVSYIGGFNIADQYVEITKKFGYWRDTHLRINGPATSILELRFLSDWNVSVPENEKLSGKLDYLYHEKPNESVYTDIQIVASGPHDEKQQIKLAFTKLITSAKKRVWIQTPYLIPDDTILDALKIAKQSGVDVKIMIPNKPDHPFIYRATQYFAQVVMKYDVDVFIYDGGFLHSKVLIMDDDVSIVGSANQDIRSYKLNFEASAVMYDKSINTELAHYFDKDLKQSTQMTQQMIDDMSIWLKFKQKTARLFSPIM
ncbi:MULTISPECIES: cardiolipin synthase [Vagococcus]|uniref:cardiolipin synthase n=1 Tax=Vagococcus TaxID=2737 RepID=UPI000E4CD5E7|nr:MULTISPECIES: cardiolipin synthase [Vagococcus]RHH71431.1 cardiolipin synthase [Vagococcus sp. AM17-17]